MLVIRFKYPVNRTDSPQDDRVFLSLYQSFYPSLTLSLFYTYLLDRYCELPKFKQEVEAKKKRKRFIGKDIGMYYIHISTNQARPSTKLIFNAAVIYLINNRFTKVDCQIIIDLRRLTARTVYLYGKEEGTDRDLGTNRRIKYPALYLCTNGSRLGQR